MSFKSKTKEQIAREVKVRMAKYFAAGRQASAQGSTFNALVTVTDNGTKKLTAPNGQTYEGIALGNPSERVDGAIALNTTQAVYADEQANFRKRDGTPPSFYFVGVHKEGLTDFGGGGNNLSYDYYWPVIYRTRKKDIYTLPAVQFEVLIPNATATSVSSERTPEIDNVLHASAIKRDFGFSENGKHFFYLALLTPLDVGVPNTTGFESTDSLGLADSVPQQLIWVVYENISFPSDDDAQIQAVGSSEYKAVECKRIRSGTILFDTDFFLEINADPGPPPNDIQIHQNLDLNPSGVLSNGAQLSLGSGLDLTNRGKTIGTPYIWFLPECGPHNDCAFRDDPFGQLGEYTLFGSTSAGYSIFMPSVENPTNCFVRKLASGKTTQTPITVFLNGINCGTAQSPKFCFDSGQIDHITSTESNIIEEGGSVRQTQMYDIGQGFLRQVDQLADVQFIVNPTPQIITTYGLRVSDFQNYSFSSYFTTSQGVFSSTARLESLVSRKVVINALLDVDLLPTVVFGNTGTISSDGVVSSSSNYTDFTVLRNFERDNEDVTLLTCDLESWKVGSVDLPSIGAAAEISRRSVKTGLKLSFPSEVVLGAPGNTRLTDTYHFYLPLNGSPTDGVWFEFNHINSKQIGQDLVPSFLSNPSKFKVLK